MRRVFKYIVRGVIGLVLLAIVAVAGAWLLVQRRLDRIWDVNTPAVSVPADAVAVERGRRLVQALAPCGECHGDDLGGKVMFDGFPMGRLYAVNLTRGRGGIGGAYTAEDWVRALLHGVRKDGRSVVFMPSHEFHFTKTDIGDLIAYMRSVPPVDREVPATRIGPMAAVLSYVGMPLLPAELIDHARVTFASEVVASTPGELGKHLVEKGGCAGCHGADFTGGGGPPPGASNITPVGIGAWSDEDFLRAVRTHVRPSGSRIDDAMPLAYGQMTDNELKAIHAFLRTVPGKGAKTKRQM
jgi:mono/diheme cytochrome c family protein